MSTTAGSLPAHPSVPQTVPIVILGSDALLAALPATPVQLAHACLRAGFANVIPASWGDELIAAGVLRRLPAFGNTPAIQCSCPIVAHRLLTVGGDLRSLLIPLIPPPVAVARYVRALSQPTRTRITYIGNCPGAIDESIDIRMSPEALIAMLAEREISLDDQPHVFESIIPPDRRRFRSQPGGVPTTEALWSETGSRALVEITSEEMVTEIAQHLLAGKSVLIDASARLGCICSGALPTIPPGEARRRIVSLEPPRASAPVIEERAPIDLDSPVPAASRTPVDVAAVSPAARPPQSAAPPRGAEPPFGPRLSPVRGVATIAEPRLPRSISSPVTQRAVLGSLPIAKGSEGRSLPRAYIARRRLSPKASPAIAFDDPPPPASLPPLRAGSPDSGADSEAPSHMACESSGDFAGFVSPDARSSSRYPDAVRYETPSGPTTPAATWPNPPRRVLVGLLAVVALIVMLSVIVGAVLGRSFTLTTPPVSASFPP